jgi:hypothetical protein
MAALTQHMCCSTILATKVAPTESGVSTQILGGNLLAKMAVLTQYRCCSTILATKVTPTDSGVSTQICGSQLAGEDGH